MRIWRRLKLASKRTAGHVFAYLPQGAFKADEGGIRKSIIIKNVSIGALAGLGGTGWGMVVSLDVDAFDAAALFSLMPTSKASREQNQSRSMDGIVRKATAHPNRAIFTNSPAPG
ncbi:hypothetical protein KW841_06470 [Pseudomonas sp. PDM28]|uniref:hypothetical protein n=1 Tax=Pseudomonas sp. PDM28 TaxID=2854770 RepID=UPI001C443D35|nr:hypothetical protein [Pseudomonas sp. PDM28]MBV7551996.1 hypothetical protein [Pseudomonas sp. PDM28]